MGEQHIDLKRRHAEGAGNHLPHDVPDVFVAPGGYPMVAKSLAAQHRELKSRLRHARCQDADGQREYLGFERLAKERGEP